MSDGCVRQGVHGQRLLECCVVCVWIFFCSSVYLSATDPAQIDEHVRCALVVPCSAAWKRLCMHTEKPMERIEKRFSCDGSGVQQLYLGGRMVTNSNLGHFTTAAGLFLGRVMRDDSCFHHVECCIGTSTRPFSLFSPVAGPPS